MTFNHSLSILDGKLPDPSPLIRVADSSGPVDEGQLRVCKKDFQPIPQPVLCR